MDPKAEKVTSGIGLAAGRCNKQLKQMNKKVFHFNLRLSLSVLVALGLLFVLQSCERDDIPLGVVDWKAGKYYTYQLKKIRQTGEGVPYSGYSGASDHLGQFSFDSKMGAEFPITNFDVTGIEYVKVTWDHDLTNHPGKNISPFVYLRDPSNHSLRTVTTIATSGVPQPSASDSYVYDGTTYYGVWTPADPTKSETARREYIFYLGGKYKTVEIVFGFDNAYTGGKSATWTVEKFPEFLVLDPSKGSKHPS